jgi:hypothetical protein
MIAYVGFNFATKMLLTHRYTEQNFHLTLLLLVNTGIPRFPWFSIYRYFPPL